MVRMDPAKHPNQAVRVSQLALLAKPGELDRHVDPLTTIFGSPLSNISTSATFRVAAPKWGKSLAMVVREAVSNEEKDWVRTRGEGLYHVTLGTLGEEREFADVALSLKKAG